MKNAFSNTEKRRIYLNISRLSLKSVVSYETSKIHLKVYSEADTSMTIKNTTNCVNSENRSTRIASG